MMYRTWMRVIILSLILFSYTQYCFSLEFTTSSVYLPNSDDLSLELKQLDFDQIEQKFNTAYEEALEILRTTIQENSYTHGFFGRNKRFKRALHALENAELQWSKKITSWRFCRTKTVAYVVNYGTLRSSIFLCPIAYIQSQEVLTQIIVHEAAHLGGTTSECQASKMEMLALYFSRIEQPFKSGYWHKCGLSKFNQKLNSTL
jgi:hypothetical protein